MLEGSFDMLNIARITSMSSWALDWCNHSHQWLFCMEINRWFDKVLAQAKNLEEWRAVFVPWLFQNDWSKKACQQLCRPRPHVKAFICQLDCIYLSNCKQHGNNWLDGIQDHFHCYVHIYKRIECQVSLKKQTTAGVFSVKPV